MESKPIIKKSTIVRDRKRISRSNESCMTNALVLLFITHLNATITFRKTKKSKATIKMYLPESITINGIQHDQITLCKYSNIFMKTVMGEEPIDVSKMDDKQYNRSKEAQINNGLLYLLHKLGFTFHIKQTKKSTKTEKLVKITVLKTPTQQEFTLDMLEIIGLEFSKIMEEMFGREMMINLTRENIPMERFPGLINEDISMIMTKSGTETGSYMTTNTITNQMNQQDNIIYQDQREIPIMNNYQFNLLNQNNINNLNNQYPITYQQQNEIIYSCEDIQQQMNQQYITMNNYITPIQGIQQCYYDENNQIYIPFNPITYY